MDGWKLAQYTIGAIVGVACLGIVAKDGPQLGQFLQGTSNAFGSFAGALGKLGG